MQKKGTGNVFAIKRYALHDGPNIRTTIFLKGCPLSCKWCHNPEGLSLRPQLTWSEKLCIFCNECVLGCPEEALCFNEDKSLEIDSEKCSSCFECVEICPSLALEATGWTATVDEIIKEILKDRPFYDQTGGGVTFSGGEPLMQSGFLLDLLQACEEIGVHRTVDTSGYADAETVLEVAKHTDLFLFDIKHLNSEKHKKLTGLGNEKILKNLKLLVENGSKLRLRLPLIKNYNDDLSHIEQVASLAASLTGVDHIDVLPYHPSAKAKYTKLNLDYNEEFFKTPGKDHIDTVVQIFKQRNLIVTIGG